MTQTKDKHKVIDEEARAGERVTARKLLSGKRLLSRWLGLICALLAG